MKPRPNFVIQNDGQQPAKRGMPTMKFRDDAPLAGAWPGAVILDVAKQRRTGPGGLFQVRQLGDELANGQVFHLSLFALRGRHRRGATGEVPRWGLYDDGVDRGGVDIWEIELAFDELKTHQGGPRAVLRFKSPELVLQEIWGHLCCHYAIRSLMAQAAEHAGHDPDRVNFVDALRTTRATLAQAGAGPPLTTTMPTAPAWRTFVARLIARLNPGAQASRVAAGDQAQDVQVAS